ncbi:cytochrome c oxidase assembly protein [Longispora albida]|uniref:cytochrome c oxidase assembly protein n=1 Tax=Longispora albida TaxID=203523 RepID=UPI0003A29FD0|nr:cytochrome c oxidase assembly protein [Longispora albida]
MRLRNTVAAGAVGLLVLFLVLRTSGAVTGRSPAGLPSAGDLVTYGLPVSRVLLDVLGALTAGFAVGAAFLTPGKDRTVGPEGYQLVRLAGWTALGWTAAALALAVFTLADFLAQPVSQLSFPMVWNFVTSVDLGKAYGLQILGAGLLAIACRFVLSRTGAALLAVGAVMTALPPAFTGHAAGAGNHQVAVTSMALHVAGAVLWLGGLAALMVIKRSAVLGVAARRYSQMAFGAFVLVLLSGVTNAAVRLGTWDALWGTNYGRLVLLKTAGLVVLGAFGVVHRRVTLRRLDGEPGLFRRLAAGEIFVLAAVFALAVGLGRTPTPVPVNPSDPDRVTDLLGFPMPPEPDLRALFGGFLPDLFFLALVACAIGYYAAGVWRLRRSGVAWPWHRTVSWVLGWLILGAITNLGLAKYAYVLFSAHMMQHMILSMLVPILLVLGAPMTLALRALKPSPGDRGAREWLVLALHSRVLRLFTHPVVALAIFVASLYALYFSPLFAVLMRSHLGHLAMLTHFILAGYLFFWVIVGVDPGRRPVSHPVLIIIHFGGMIFHAFFGVILLQAKILVADDWFSIVRPPWLTDPAADQHLGAGITWSFGEIPSAIVFVILVLQWIRADEREQRRLDRAADRAAASGEEDEWMRYNEYLKRLSVESTEPAGSASPAGPVVQRSIDGPA